MLTFRRNKKILQTVEIHNKDPLSLNTYQEILQKEETPIFSLLVCETTQFVYLARDIAEMRYSLDEQINVYLLRDPLSREVVEDVWYFEVKKNPIYNGNPRKPESVPVDSLGGTLHHRKVEDIQDVERNTVIYADFISNELGVLYDKDLQYKVLNYRKDKGDVVGLVIYILVVIAVLFFLLLLFSFFVKASTSQIKF